MKVIRAEFVTSATRPDGYPGVDLPEIALAGRSNVGKSSALNTLTGRKGLAVTSTTPGRTRLVNFFDVELALSPTRTLDLRLVDLPGYGYANAAKSEREEWRARVDAYITGRVSLRGVIHLLDIRHDPSEHDEMLADWLRSLGRDSIPVFTKADKLSRNERTTRTARLERALGIAKGQGTPFSSLTGDGRDRVWKKILAAL